MYRIVGFVLLLLPALPALAAGDEPKDKPADQYRALVKQYNDSRKAFMEAYRKAKTPEERRKAFENYPQPDKTAPKFLELAQKNPKDPAALDAATWVLTNARTPKFTAQALTILSQNWIESPKIGRACLALARGFGKETEPFLRAVLKKNPNHDAQGAACLALADYLKELPSLVEGLKDRPQMATYYEKQLGKEYVQQLKHLDTANVNKEAEELFDRAINKYGDVRANGRTIAALAKPPLFELRHLAIGKKAPDIVGEDIDGKKFKLSDYRGKVVLLDFWGNW